MDYLARAKRLEEIPFLMREFEEQKKLSEEFWIESEMKRVRDVCYLEVLTGHAALLRQ